MKQIDFLCLGTDSGNALNNEQCEYFNIDDGNPSFSYDYNRYNTTKTQHLNRLAELRNLETMYIFKQKLYFTS